MKSRPLWEDGLVEGSREAGNGDGGGGKMEDVPRQP